MAKMDLKFLYGVDEEDAARLMVSFGLAAYRGRQLLEWLYKKKVDSIQEARNLPQALRDRLAAEYAIYAMHPEAVVEREGSESTKFLFRTPDGLLLESVLITQQNRRTVCVSTQLGCKIGCPFCASGKGKFGRNLTAGEIVEQVAWIEKKTGKGATNVVFMGMGEPFDNFEATMKALKILQAPWGFALGARRITVSTSGVVPKILEFVKRSEGRVRLAVSLHSSDPQKRSRLVPINKRYGLKQLLQTLQQVHTKLKREITFEYTLIKDVNDSIEEAEGVGRLAKTLRAKVNLIPYNPIREMDYEQPTPQRLERFRDILHKHGVRVTVRQTAGREIEAACGQLRLYRES